MAVYFLSTTTKAKLHQKVQQSPALRERNLGKWQGQSIEKLKESGDRLLLHQWSGHAPDGESLEALARRSVVFLSQLKSRPITLLVGHGGLIRVLIGLLDGTDRNAIGRVDIPNAVPIIRDVDPETWAHLNDELTR